MHVGRINLGSALVVIGLLLVLMKWGFLDWSLWWSLIAWWPAFLMVFGLNLALQRTRLWFLPTILALLVVIFAVTVGGFNRADWQTRTLNVSEPVPEKTDEARLVLDMGVGSIILDGQAMGLYDADFRFSGDAPSRLLEPLAGNAVKVEVRQEDRRAPKWVRGFAERWSVRLNPQVTVDAEVSAAAVNLDVNFASLPLRVLDVSAGIGSINLNLAENGVRTDIFINATISDITLQVPPNVGVLVQMASLITSHNLHDVGYESSVDGYRSTNYETVASQVYVYVAATAARLKVVTDAVNPDAAITSASTSASTQ